MKQCLTLVFCLFVLRAAAKDVTIIIHNTDSTLRHELVEVDADAVYKTMQVEKGTPLCIYNSARQEMVYQLTHDGLLLLDVTARPGTDVTYMVSVGKPMEMKPSVYGGLYKIRKDDIAWENDRGAYRVYGPALQRTGEKSYGTDIWVKNTPELVIDQRYKMDDEGNRQESRLYREGRRHEADSIDRATSFHLDHGNGLDAYAVGATLGCGAPALMQDGRLVYPYCYKDYEILDNGPLRFTVKLDYNPSAVGTDQDVVEHRIISLDKGSNFCRLTAWYTNMKHAHDFASGVVVHGQKEYVVLGKDFVAYTDPTDDPKKNNSEIYVACLFPEGMVKATLQHADKQQGINADHALGIYSNLKDSERITYYFGSAWSQYDVRSSKEWLDRIASFMHALKVKMDVEVK